MPEIRIDVYRSIPVEIGVVYRCLADFERAQPRLLPDSIRDYAVLAGGVGEGTVATFAMTINGRVRHFSFRISEPIRNKVITAYDHDSHLTVTWLLRPDGPTTEVEIEAYWSEPEARIGILRVWWANIVVRRTLNHVLDRLPDVIEEFGYDRPEPPGVRR